MTMYFPSDSIFLSKFETITHCSKNSTQKLPKSTGYHVSAEFLEG